MTSLRSLLLSPDPVGALRSLQAAGKLADAFPYIAALAMPIPKGFHHKDNLEHSLKVLENAMAQEGPTADIILRTAALLHDIGKPATRDFPRRGVVTFTNHETVGARIARKLLKKEGYSKEEQEVITRLIALHMRSHGFHETLWTDAAARRLATDAKTPETLAQLLILFTSDVTSGKPGRVQAVRQSIAQLNKLLGAVQAKDERAALRPAIDGHTVMEHFDLKPGRELGAIMRYLNSDEGVHLSEAEALAAVEAMLAPAAE